MQLRKNQIVDVNLKDLLFQTLYRWRSILIAALIGALLLCGYQYLTVKNAHDAGKLTKEERQYELNLQKYRENLEKNEKIIQAGTKALEETKKYQDESIFYQLDPLSVWTATNKYLIKADPSVLEKLQAGSEYDPVDDLLSAYLYPWSGAEDEELKEVFGTENPDYVKELVDSVINIETNTVTVSVKGSSREYVQAGIAFLDSRIQMLAAGKAQEIDKHTVTLISADVSQGASDTLAVKQDSLLNSISNNQEAIQEAREALDALKADGEPSEPGMHLAKMAVIGFILGAAVLFFLYAALYLFNGKLNNANEMTERYQISLLGEIPKAGSLRGGRGLDKLFSKWELGRKKQGEETIYDNIAALLAEKEGDHTILLLSTLPEDRISPVCEALKKRLPDKMIETKADMLRNSKAIGEAASADAVILVEEKHVSHLKEIDQMAEMLIFSKASVIGSIVL